MKKLIPLLVSSILVIGSFGCQDATKNASETPTTNEATKTAKEASANTKTTAKEAAANTKTTAKSTTETSKTPAKEAAANTKTTAKSTTETSKTPAKEAAANTKTTATETATKSLILSKLTEKIPGSKLAVEDKDGVVTVTGTVPTTADIKKIEPLVKEQKGVKSVKVEAKAAKAQ
ncbi:transport-associated protein [Tolypothrix tenuis PCC 7101]|uniref:Transport-associated protein n=1 Tax=Tolypothrix tenuis PCC 7101 TaxID=231146 RepID=A0A1Z4N7Z0_9CYAN|nr:BON domain-containing protein [Aulosira sp. FACHB-113]BAZ01840.1 transport-associated protein [Tolypothrix tenuis PCC 7101]BAZ74235.1 transport-associated protein [Aulosira laxa NIES-50]